MQMISLKNTKTILAFLFSLLILISTGCASFDLDPNQEDGANDVAPILHNEPYYPTDFKDLLIPGELAWNHEKSMVINTEAFSGGILNFSGRVELISLTNFFITSMVNDGWKMPGSVRSQNVLLSFFKPGQTCMIKIDEGEYGLKTNVNIYITKDLSSTN